MIIFHAAHSPEHMLDTFLQMKPASRGHVEVAKAFAACLAGMAGAVTATPLGARTFLKYVFVCFIINFFLGVPAFSVCLSSAFYCSLLPQCSHLFSTLWFINFSYFLVLD